MNMMIFRVLLSISLLTLSILSLKNGQLIDHRIVNDYISDWMWAALVYRGVISLMMFLAFIFLFGAGNFLIKSLLLIVTFLIIADTVNFFTTNSRYPAVFFNAEFSTLFWSTLILFSLSLIAVLKNTEKVKLKKWMYFSLLIPVFALNFIRVVYRDDWMFVTSDERTITKKEVASLMNYETADSLSEDLLVAFFSTSCSYCRAAALKIGISQNKNLLPKTVFIFAGKKMEIEEFIVNTDTKNLLALNIEHQQFEKLAGFSMPSIFYLTESSCQQFVGAQFNNIVLHKIKP